MLEWEREAWTIREKREAKGVEVKRINQIQLAERNRQKPNNTGHTWNDTITIMCVIGMLGTKQSAQNQQKCTQMAHESEKERAHIKSRKTEEKKLLN